MKNCFIIFVLFLVGCHARFESNSKDSKSNEGVIELVKTQVSCEYDPSFKAEAHKCVIECINGAKNNETDEALPYNCKNTCDKVYCKNNITFWDDNKENWFACGKGLEKKFYTACVNAGWKKEEEPKEDTNGI